MKTKRISESELNDIIYNKVLNELRLKEYRDTFSDGLDGDHFYVRPNGDTNIGTKLDYYHPGEGGKRTNKTMRLHGINGKDTTSTVNYTNSVIYHGKGDLCSQIREKVEKLFFENSKIEWTDKEKDKISKILYEISSLADLTKKEGNKKRGYNGPDDNESEEMNEGYNGNKMLMI